MSGDEMDSALLSLYEPTDRHTDHVLVVVDVPQPTPEAGLAVRWSPIEHLSGVGEIDIGDGRFAFLAKRRRELGRDLAALRRSLLWAPELEGVEHWVWIEPLPEGGDSLDGFMVALRGGGA